VGIRVHSLIPLHFGVLAACCSSFYSNVDRMKDNSNKYCKIIALV